MTKVRFTITMSLDGYAAGPDQSLEEPLGKGGEALHDWAWATRTFREQHGLEGGAAEGRPGSSASSSRARPRSPTTAMCGPARRSAAWFPRHGLIPRADRIDHRP